MLQDINERLAKAVEQRRLRAKLTRDLRAVEKDLQEHSAQFDELARQLEKEQVDVEKLERTSLKGLFYSVLGSREQQLEKERQEMLSAQLRYQQVKHQVEYLEGQRNVLAQQVDGLAGAERAYESLLAEKERLLRETGDAVAGQLLDLTERIAGMEAEIKEIGEAIGAGQSVISGLDQVIEALERAEGWGAWDMLGGGILSTAVKHSHIDEARSGIHSVQTQMGRFQRELADVHRHADLSIDIDGLTSFADFFFDGLIVDWVVQSRIAESRSKAVEARRVVSKTVKELQGLRKSAQQRRGDLQGQRARLVEES